MTQQEPNRPVAEFRVGGTITASVWENTVQRDGRDITTYSVQIQKRYFCKADQDWKTSKSLYANDIPRAVLALQKAYEWIMAQPRNGATEKSVAETEDGPF